MCFPLSNDVFRTTLHSTEKPIAYSRRDATQGGFYFAKSPLAGEWDHTFATVALRFAV